MKRYFPWTLALTGALFACGGVEEDGLEDDGAAVTGTRIERSLAVTDPTILARFGFTRTFDAIRASSLDAGEAFAASETRLATYQRWMRSFGLGTDGCDRASIDPNNYGLVCPRTAEAKLATVDPFAANATVRFVPVGLFNRFDLMPSNGATCGEHRIVYAMQTTAGAPLGGRGFIIFEAALPNPHPELGVDGCLPVARFWQGLTNDANVASRAAKLERFYYTGLPGFSAVVRAANYGFFNRTVAAQAGRPGQIRTNFFVDGLEWHLREFKVRQRCSTNTACFLDYEHHTVKTNPAEELFAGTHTSATDFRTAFTAQVRRLASNNVNTISMAIANRFNEFESSAQAGDVVYRSFSNAAMRSAIQAELTRIGSTLTVNNILDRATTQTCGGCHQLSSGVNLGGGLTWPSSGFFVHIDETRTLSPALTTVFLPRRRQILEAFITAREAGVSSPGNPGETIGERAVDSAN